jgi:hypothetical protein
VQNNENDIITVQQLNETAKNLRPNVKPPEKRIDEFYISEPMVQRGSGFKIPLKVVVKKRYQSLFERFYLYFSKNAKVLNGVYTNRLAGKFPRHSNLRPRNTGTVIGDIKVDEKFIEPVIRKISPRIKTDGGGFVSELSESNNFSITHCGVYIPIF